MQVRCLHVIFYLFFQKCLSAMMTLLANFTFSSAFLAVCLFWRIDELCKLSYLYLFFFKGLKRLPTKVVRVVSWWFIFFLFYCIYHAQKLTFFACWHFHLSYYNFGFMTTSNHILCFDNYFSNWYYLYDIIYSMKVTIYINVR